MALVLNATKDFKADKMNQDSRGNDINNQFSQGSHFDRGPASYRCNFCPGSFPSLYHLQCHNVYKHSSILSNHGEELKQKSPDVSSTKSKTSAFYMSQEKNNFESSQTGIQYNIVNPEIKTSLANQQLDKGQKVGSLESGALDLSTVKNRENLVSSTVFGSTNLEPKPTEVSSSLPEISTSSTEISSTHVDEETDSDNDESDKLVIDTQSEVTQENGHQNEADKLKSHDNPPLRSFSENFRHNNEIVANSEHFSHNTQHSRLLQHEIRPTNAQLPNRGYYHNIPSNENHQVDYRSRSPLGPTSHEKLEETVDRGSYPPYYNPQLDNKIPGIEHQSLLSMIPPLPNMGMIGNFPMPFGFSPFMPMMYPPNSFMPQANPTNTQDGRFPLQGDTFPSNVVTSLPYRPNLNLPPSKGAPVRRNSGNNKSRSSSKKGDKKPKEVLEIYQCKSCNRQFSQVGNFHNHMKTHESKVCACGICNMEFSDSYELQRHMRNTHTGSMPYKCEQCDREFSQYNNLRRHLRVHNGKNYKCHLCGRTFNEVFYLEMHMGSHTGERTYKCGVCSATFSDNSELQKHVSTHSAEELHTCDVCGKSFSKACVLRQHKKMHSGLRPFKCEVCEKSFIHRHHLTIHSRMHNSNKPYVCKICKKEFVQTSHLYKHIRQHTEQPGVTEAMIHESLAPILEKLKESDNKTDNSLSAEDLNVFEKQRQNDDSDPSSDNDLEKEQKLKDAASHDNTQSLMSTDIASLVGNGERERTLVENLKYKKEIEKPESLKGNNYQNDTDFDKTSMKPKISTLKDSEKTAAVDNNDENTQKEAKLVATGTSVTEFINGSLKEMENLYRQHRYNDELSFKDCEIKKDVCDSDDNFDNASDKTGISVDSAFSEQRFVSSPHSSIPYNEQCLEMPNLPRIAQYNIPEDLAIKKNNLTCLKEQVSVNQDIGRFSPISQSGEALSEEDFRSRSNSATENLENLNPPVVSPRVVSVDSILKEQQILRDNCPNDSPKPEIVMPLKKRRRYAPRLKKKSTEEIEVHVTEEPSVEKPVYPQMIPPEAQQMYFLQLQQMQMALAANVMAAQGAMMQNLNVSEQMKSLQANNQRGVPNDLSIPRQKFQSPPKNDP